MTPEEREAINKAARDQRQADVQRQAAEVRRRSERDAENMRNAVERNR